jgi:hypothetical protein
MEELLQPHFELPPNVPANQLMQPTDLNEDSTSSSTATSQLPLPGADISLPSTHNMSSPFVCEFPLSAAGAPISGYGKHSDDAYRESLHTLNSISPSDTTNIYAPFTSKLDWETAQWAKLRGPGSTSFSEFLAIDGVRVLSFITYNTKICLGGREAWTVFQELSGAQ